MHAPPAKRVLEDGEEGEVVAWRVSAEEGGRVVRQSRAGAAREVGDLDRGFGRRKEFLQRQLFAEG